MSHATLIMKSTRLCNLRCVYCKDWGAGTDQTMSFEVLASATKNVLEDPFHSEVTFVWHGGETTILPISFYEKALYLQSSFKKPNQRIYNMLQTNATRITREWTSFLYHNKFSVGVSIDGPAEMHDNKRIHVSGKGSYKSVQNGIRMLRDKKIPISVLMVVTKETLALGAEGIFNFFVQEQISNFGLLAVTPGNYPDAIPSSPVDNYVTPVEMNCLLAELYDLRKKLGLEGKVHIRELDMLEQKISTKNVTSCQVAGNCIGHYYIVNPNGDVAHCDLFLGDPAYEFGNILHNTFADFGSSQVMLNLIDKESRQIERLKKCSEFKICSGWCPHERYLSVRHNPDHTDNCCGRRDLIKHIRNRTKDQNSQVPHTCS